MMVMPLGVFSRLDSLSLNSQRIGAGFLADLGQFKPTMGWNALAGIYYFLAASPVRERRCRALCLNVLAGIYCF
jgi:hypothetical protein